MCGIIGYVGKKAAMPILLEGLRRLEYRGYDSAGIAVLDGDELLVRKKKGKIGEGLARLLKSEPVAGISASATPAGPHTARPRIKIPIRTSTNPAGSPSFITASSKITTRSGKNCSPPATNSNPAPIPRCSRI